MSNDKIMPQVLISSNLIALRIISYCQLHSSQPYFERLGMTYPLLYM